MNESQQIIFDDADYITSNTQTKSNAMFSLCIPNNQLTQYSIFFPCKSLKQIWFVKIQTSGQPYDIQFSFKKQFQI